MNTEPVDLLLKIYNSDNSCLPIDDIPESFADVLEECINSRLLFKYYNNIHLTSPGIKKCDEYYLNVCGIDDYSDDIKKKFGAISFATTLTKLEKLALQCLYFDSNASSVKEGVAKIGRFSFMTLVRVGLATVDTGVTNNEFKITDAGREVSVAIQEVSAMLCEMRLNYSRH